MKRKRNNIAPLILMLIFLLPSVVRLEHHHDEDTLVCKAKNEKHYHRYHEKCAICSFEFSVFSQDHQHIAIKKEPSKINYSNLYNSPAFSNFSKYSFLLRAPPC